MKRKDRELNIFSMSALDLFASAMGAFILIMLVLMPFYLKQTPSPTEPTPPQECPVCQECEVCEQCEVCEVCEQCEVCEVCPEPQVVEVPVVLDNLLAVEMNWAKTVDADLHVFTPDGEYYYGNREISGAPGLMTIDNTSGSNTKATERWLSFEPTEGRYEICFLYYSSQGPRMDVWGKLLKPSGSVELRVSLSPKQQECPLRFRINSGFRYERLP